MKFKILSAEIATVENGDNAGDEFIMLSVIEDSIFAEGHPHKVVKFVPQENIPLWEAAIEKGKFPPFNGSYHIVKDLPTYKARETSDEQNTMRLLVENDSDGNPRSNPHKTAMRIIKSRMILVDDGYVDEEAADATDIDELITRNPAAADRPAGKPRHMR